MNRNMLFVVYCTLCYCTAFMHGSQEMVPPQPPQKDLKQRVLAEYKIDAGTESEALVIEYASLSADELRVHEEKYHTKYLEYLEALVVFNHAHSLSIQPECPALYFVPCTRVERHKNSGSLLFAPQQRSLSKDDSQCKLSDDRLDAWKDTIRKLYVINRQ